MDKRKSHPTSLYEVESRGVDETLAEAREKERVPSRGRQPIRRPDRKRNYRDSLIRFDCPSGEAAELATFGRSGISRQSAHTDADDRVRYLGVCGWKGGFPYETECRLVSLANTSASPMLSPRSASPGLAAQRGSARLSASAYATLV